MARIRATKFAQVGLAECLRAELVNSRIHVSVVLPVSTETEFQEVMTRHSGAIARARGPRQSADAVADAIARALERPVPEVYPLRKARGLALLNASHPFLRPPLSSVDATRRTVLGGGLSGHEARNPKSREETRWGPPAFGGPHRLSLH